MKKIKKVWEENKVLFVLGIILLICLVVFAVVSMTYFYGSSKSVYGNRLDITKEMPLNSKLLDDIKNELESNSKVDSVNTILKGKIVYITIVFTTDVKMDEAKKIANTVIELFNADELEVYDIQFTIKNPDKEVGYTLMGAWNSNGNGSIVWNNYNIEKESAEQ